MSEPTQPSPETTRRSRRTGLIVGGTLGTLALLGGGTYVAGYLMAGDHTPRNASVEGIAIGGLTETDAVAKLQSELAPRYTKAITLTADGKRATLKPADAGLTINLPATVRQAGAGKSWSPSHIWNVLSGGTDMNTVTVVDEPRLKQAVSAAAPTFAVKPKDASLTVKDGKAVTTPAVDAVALDVDATAGAVRKAWPASSEVAASTKKTEPAISNADVDAVRKQTVDPALSAPIVVKAGDKKLSLSPTAIGKAMTITAKDGALTASVDIKRLWKGAQTDIDKLGFDQGKDARFVFEGGRPVVRPSSDGIGIKEEDFTKAVQPALGKTGAERTVSVPVTKVPAKLSTDKANKLGVKEVIGEFTTQFPYAEYRNINLTRAAQLLNGQTVLPGETWSMNDALGQRTAANGFVDGYVIQGSRLKKETGGGVSQSATTVFNAIFFAGLEDVEHHPHTLYFPRYPAGREATLYYGHLDLKFKNNTNYGVVLQAYTQKAAPGGEGSITVKVWSTKTWDAVKSTELVKSNYYDAPDETSNDPKCEPQSPSPGFTVNYSRLFIKGGKTVRTEPFRWTYSATPKVTCV